MLGRSTPRIVIANVFILVFGRIDNALLLGRTHPDIAF